jgi:hypothetical protein
MPEPLADAWGCDGSIHPGAVFMNTANPGGQRSRSLVHVFDALSRVPGLDVVESTAIPPQCIALGGRIAAIVDDHDDWRSASPAHDGEMVGLIRRVGAPIVFKHQYRSGIAYPPGTVSAGYFCAENVPSPPGDLCERVRPVDISARMRADGRDYGTPGAVGGWLEARAAVVEQASRLSREGWIARTGKADRDAYDAELLDTKIGFDWRGWGKLTRRMIEYIRAGVVMVTNPLGAEWPIREDVALEDGVHCIYCDDPSRFADLARSLLLDPARMARIRRNVVELWRDKLCPAAMGAWYWEKLCSQGIGAPRRPPQSLDSADGPRV